MLKTLITRQEEHNRNIEGKKTNSNASSKESNGKNWWDNADYEDKPNLQRSTEEVSNWRKNDPIPNSERSKWRQDKSPSNDLRQILDWKRNNNNNNSSPKILSSKSFNNKENLVFDKRDFIFRDVPKKIREQLLLDEVGMYSVTDMRTADEISNFIAKLDGLNEDNIVITDGTACAGGNTISFCKKFKKVQAVELDQKRHGMLKHNLKILGCTNATCHHANYLELICNLTQDIVFLDPPWGGPSYKEKHEVELFLGDVPLDEICEKLKTRTKYIIIKAPTNLNYEKFKAKITGNVRVFHKFRKMILIVVDYYNPPEVLQRYVVTNEYYKDDNKTNENGSKTKETYKNHNTDAKDKKTTDNSTYAAIATDAAAAVVIYCRDYDCGDYAYSRAYEAALAVARDGATAAHTAATAAYLDATDDVAHASDYNDPVVADTYLQFAYNYDYYVTNGDDSADDVNSAKDDNGADDIYRAELDAAVNAPLDDNDDF